MNAHCPLLSNQLLRLSVYDMDTGAAKLDIDDTERVVESELCDVLLAATDGCWDDNAINRNIRSIATGATFIWSRSTTILQIANQIKYWIVFKCNVTVDSNHLQNYHTYNICF